MLRGGEALPRLRIPRNLHPPPFSLREKSGGRTPQSHARHAGRRVSCRASPQSCAEWAGWRAKSAQVALDVPSVSEVPFSFSPRRALFETRRVWPRGTPWYEVKYGVFRFGGSQGEIVQPFAKALTMAKKVA